MAWPKGPETPERREKRLTALKLVQQTPEYRAKLSVARMGHVGYNKGMPAKGAQLEALQRGWEKQKTNPHPLSEETKAKMRAGYAEYVSRGVPVETRQKLSLSQKRAYEEGRRLKGPLHPNWKDGMSKLRSRQYRGGRYNKWRCTVLQRDQYRCTECGSNEFLEAHHIKPKSAYPELVYDVNNGQTLCRTCHMKTDSYAGKQNGVCHSW